ncbi:PD-(D/E)XK motif protein [Pedobacter frigoris]|uniref:PD-(D/E)XK motif protein n=1 Tax=Pedobacter frigoris TaxID=2571272 RepID=UPI00292FD6D0|nr:PD-(D/E)XK motif protein [Pedobacter frigoris]
MAILSKEFEKLIAENSTQSEAYLVTDIPKFQQHKLGISEFGLPSFFILCDKVDESCMDYRLEMIDIQSGRNCQLLIDSKEKITGVYTIISLKSDMLQVLDYFLDAIFLLITNLPLTVKSKELGSELERLARLFNKFSLPATNTIQGLWAELLIIELSKNPIYLVNSWHYKSNDKYDFNDGVDKIEIKSTSGERRVHNFSLDQLNPNVNSNLVISSVLVKRTGYGKSVFELTRSIERRLLNNEDILRFREMVASTLGVDFYSASEVFYDYQFAVDNLAHYDYQSIPRIKSIDIPRSVTNVKFSCDLTGLDEFSIGSLDSKLINCLMKI